MEFAVQYRRTSTLDPVEGTLLAFLAAALKQQQRPEALFFGEIAKPLAFRNLLLAVHRAVISRFYRPELWSELDPVITNGCEHLRLEGFSGCAGVYVRADLTQDLFEYGRFGPAGTNNVDLNQAFVGNLAALRPGKKAGFEVGVDSIRLSTHRGETVERKVPLPDRWLKSFLQIQAVQERAQPHAELSATAARKLLHGIPRSRAETLYLILSSERPRVLHRRPAGDRDALEVHGAHRLRLLDGVLADSRTVRIYRVPDTGVSIWSAEGPGGRLTLALSSRVNRGFSGDGDALRRVAGERDPVQIELLRRSIERLNHFSIAELAAAEKLPEAEVHELVDHLAGQGLLGYDRDQDRFFHRVLPYLGTETRLPPRLKGAQRLLEQERVELESINRSTEGLSAEGWVEGEGGQYRVRLTLDPRGFLAHGDCTCRWILSHGLERGPCKHLMALRLFAEDREPGT